MTQTRNTPGIPFLRRAALFGIGLVAMLTGCGVDIPEKWKEFVPEEERGALTKAIASEAGTFNAAGVIVWYDAGKTTPHKVGLAYRKLIEGKGYKALYECPEGKSFDQTFAKVDGDKLETVKFSAYVLTEDTIDGKLTRTDKLGALTLSEKQTDCTWTAFGKETCTSIKNRRCSLR